MVGSANCHGMFIGIWRRTPSALMEICVLVFRRPCAECCGKIWTSCCSLWEQLELHGMGDLRPGFSSRSLLDLGEDCGGSFSVRIGFEGVFVNLTEVFTF